MRHSRVLMAIVLTLVLPAVARASSDCSCAASRVQVAPSVEILDDIRVTVQATGSAPQALWLLNPSETFALYLDGDTPPPITLREPRLRRHDFVRSTTGSPLPAPMASPPLVEHSDALLEAPAGRYRMRVAYSLAPMPWRRGEICVVTSDAFLVERSSQHRNVR